MELANIDIISQRQPLCRCTISLTDALDKDMQGVGVALSYLLDECSMVSKALDAAAIIELTAYYDFPDYSVSTPIVYNPDDYPIIAFIVYASLEENNTSKIIFDVTFCNPDESFCKKTMGECSRSEMSDFIREFILSSYEEMPD